MMTFLEKNYFKYSNIFDINTFKIYYIIFEILFIDT